MQDISQIGKKVRHEMVGNASDPSFGDRPNRIFYLFCLCVCVGVLCVAGTDHRLSEVHARLMVQNISLHSLLESRPLKQQSHKMPHH